MAQNHSGHRERVRERFERDGIDSLETHVLIELLLFYSIPRADTNVIAHDLLNRFGSLSGVFEAPYGELLKVKGVGESTATLLRLIPGITRCYLSDKNSAGIVLDTSKKLGEFFLPRFIGRNKEVAFLLCLDLKCKVLYCGALIEGTLDSVTVDLRRIAEIAMGISASAIVLAHNHTQGFAVPSSADQHVTIIIRDSLKPLSIKLIDHIIVARDDFVSMRDSGYLMY